MRTRLTFLAALLAALTLPVGPAVAGGPSPAQLTRAGWTCILPPPDFNPNVHCLPANQLAGVVSKDQVLASRLLGLANSAYFASMTEISTVQEAIVRMGTAPSIKSRTTPPRRSSFTRRSAATGSPRASGSSTRRFAKAFRRFAA